MPPVAKWAASPPSWEEQLMAITPKSCARKHRTGASMLAARRKWWRGMRRQTDETAKGMKGHEKTNWWNSKRSMKGHEKTQIQTAVKNEGAWEDKLIQNQQKWCVKGSTLSTKTHCMKQQKEWRAWEDKLMKQYQGHEGAWPRQTDETAEGMKGHNQDKQMKQRKEWRVVPRHTDLWHTPAMKHKTLPWHGQTGDQDTLCKDTDSAKTH